MRARQKWHCGPVAHFCCRKGLSILYLRKNTTTVPTRPSGPVSCTVAWYPQRRFFEPRLKSGMVQNRVTIMCVCGVSVHCGLVAHLFCRKVLSIRCLRKHTTTVPTRPSGPVSCTVACYPQRLFVEPRLKSALIIVAIDCSEIGCIDEHRFAKLEKVGAPVGRVPRASALNPPAHASSEMPSAPQTSRPEWRRCAARRAWNRSAWAHPQPRTAFCPEGTE